MFLLQSKQKKSFHSFGKNIHEQRHEIHILEYSSNRIIVESNLTNYIWLVNYVREEGSHWTYTLLPDTRAVSYGITDPLRGQVSGIKYSIVRPPVGSLPVLRNTIYNQVTNEQEVLGMKRKV